MQKGGEKVCHKELIRPVILFDLWDLCVKDKRLKLLI